ncbi:MAG: hypothetical protein IJV15_14130 [Lachnospiraceae bacterium]|nr:hypothetical protein [Lachnospiraceae bacterium]
MIKIKQKELLETVFGKIYSKEFDAKSIDDRITMQKTVFLMREMGVSCGNYEFIWDQFGPFSAKLSDDLKVDNTEKSQEIKFNKKADEVISKIKRIAEIKSEYNIRYWMETIASLCYLKKYMYPSFDDDKIIEILESKKNYLNKREINKMAFGNLKEIMEI